MEVTEDSAVKDFLEILEVRWGNDAGSSTSTMGLRRRRHNCDNSSSPHLLPLAGTALRELVWQAYPRVRHLYK